MITDSLPCLDYTMLVEDGVDVMVLQKSGIQLQERSSRT